MSERAKERERRHFKFYLAVFIAAAKWCHCQHCFGIVFQKPNTNGSVLENAPAITTK